METTPVMIGMTLYSRYLEDLDKDENKMRINNPVNVPTLDPEVVFIKQGEFKRTVMSQKQRLMSLKRTLINTERMMLSKTRRTEPVTRNLKMQK